MQTNNNWLFARALTSLLALEATLSVAGCANGTENTATAAPVSTETSNTSPAATQTTTTPAPTSSAPVALPTAGATVAAADVASLRAAGGHVYVSPNGIGDGLVVDPAAPLPTVVVTDVHAGITDTQDPNDMKAFEAHQAPECAAMQAIKDARIRVFVLWRQPASMTATSVQGTSYQVVGFNSESPQGTGIFATKTRALSAAQPLFAANANVPLISFDGPASYPAKG